MKQQRDSKKRIAFPIQLFEGPDSAVATPREIHIVPTGEWEHWSGYEFSITSDTVKQLVANFNSGVKKDIPITAGHDNGMNGGELPAVGWFTELVDHGVNGLYGFVEWNAEGLRLLSEKSFKYFSAEIDFESHDLETGEDHGVVLTGGALTNHPFFKQLDMDPSLGFSEEDRKAASEILMFSVPSIMQQFNFQSMDINEITAKKAEDLSTEEKAFLVEHKDELSDEQKTAFESVLPVAADEGEGDEGTGGGADEGDGNGEGDAGKVDASARGKGGKTVTLSEAEVKILRSQADKGALAFAEIERMKLAEEVAKLVLSESNKDGRILPKQKEAVVALMFSMNKTQRDQFRNIVNNMPKPAVSFSEIGDGGKAGETTVFAEVNIKVAELTKATPTLTYSDALRQVFKTNPELATRYNEANLEEAE